MSFRLDERLESSSYFVTDLGLCQLRLNRDSRYGWAVLIPRVAGAVEWFDLSPSQAAQALDEANRVGAWLKRELGATKINIAAIGNIVSQLHIHVVARRVGDAAWPGPIWGVGEAVPYAPGVAEALAGRLAQAFAA